MRNFWTVFILILATSAIVRAQGFEQRMSSLLSEDFLFTGPNCFNSALRALGLQKYKRHLLETEMDFILRSFCIPSPRLAEKSLGVLRSPVSRVPLHGFVPLEKNYVFTKNGLSKRAKNEIQTERQMLSLHTMAAMKNCSSEDPQNCAPLRVEYYVCDSLKTFDIESLMGDIQESRTLAFSSESHDLFRQSMKKLMSEGTTNRGCETRQHAVKSLIASWTLINYASITPGEFSKVENLISDLKAWSEMSHCETYSERP